MTVRRSNRDVEDLMWRSQDAGTSLRREEAIEKLKPIYAQLVSKPVLDALFIDCEVTYNPKLEFDSAVEEFILMAKNAGIVVSRDVAVTRLESYFKGGKVY